MFFCEDLSRTWSMTRFLWSLFGGKSEAMVHRRSSISTPRYTSMYSISLHRIRSIKRCLTPYALPVSCLCSIILRAQQLKYRRMIGRISKASPKHHLHVANCRQFSFGGAFRQPKLNFHSSGPWICATLNGKSHRDVCMTIRAWFSRTSNLTFEGVCHFLVWLTIEPFRIPRRRLVLADHLLKKPFIIQRKSLQGMRKSLVEPYSENQNTNHTSMRWSTWSTYLSALLWKSWDRLVALKESRNRMLV